MIHVECLAPTMIDHNQSEANRSTQAAAQITDASRTT
jgi:hypothetical protein